MNRAERRRATARRAVSRVPLRSDEIREERITLADGRSAISVNAMTETARLMADAEATLFEELSAIGCTAAPRILGRTSSGYLREHPTPLRRMTGRRVAQLDTPATTERVGRARARDELEQVLTGMHERGWALVPALDSPLGIRADGTVCLVDLRGLQQTTRLAGVMADRQWISDVLADDDRTLVRPSETAPDGTAHSSAADAAGAVRGPSPSSPPPHSPPSSPHTDSASPYTTASLPPPSPRACSSPGGRGRQRVQLLAHARAADAPPCAGGRGRRVQLLAHARAADAPPCVGGSRAGCGNSGRGGTIGRVPRRPSRGLGCTRR